MQGFSKFLGLFQVIMANPWLVSMWFIFGIFLECIANHLFFGCFWYIPLPFIAPTCKYMFIHDRFFIAILVCQSVIHYHDIPDSQPTTSQIGGQIGNQELASVDGGVTWRDDLLSIQVREDLCFSDPPCCMICEEIGISISLGWHHDHGQSTYPP